MILQKVSFDPSLFRMELHKALKELLAEEVQELKQWCVRTFGITYCLHADPQFSLSA
ncbi:MAG: hypothetical protein R2794_06475 [Chitinophagales bacterium]